MAQFLHDFPPGPLDFYRKRASFDWKKLKMYLDTEDIVKFQHDVSEVISTHPDWQKDLLSDTFDEERRKASRQAFAYKHIEILSLPYLLENFKRSAAATRMMMQLSPSAAVKYSVGDSLFINVIRGAGTARHYKYLEESEEGRIFGCFCLTEIGHGTNTKGMRTSATYDKENKQFIMHSPDFEAAKCWAGSLGQTATHAIVFAQLYIDGTNYGLHTFVVKVRDPVTLLPCPGVIVGDMGEKIGLNGIDNGFVMFDQYRIPREDLLNRNGDVTEDGKYVTPFKDPNQRHGASLGALSLGRVGITNICDSYASKALTIAIRYAAVRRQFGPEGQEEVPILEYQTHQHRLLPFLAASYVVRVFAVNLLEIQYQFTIDTVLGENKESLPDLGMELHAVSSACKPVAGWLARDTIQECREACAGHGYLKAAGLGDIRNDNDANCTYEGENHVLIQQTSNWLLKFWPAVVNGQKISTPMKSADFLSNAREIYNFKFTANTEEDLLKPDAVISAYQWLVCYYLRETKDKIDRNVKSGKDAFSAKNDSQVFYAKNLSIAFIQHFFLQHMLIFINGAPDVAMKTVLLKLFSLYGLWSLEKFLPTLYQGGYAMGPKPTTLIQEAILNLCAKIKDDAVSLIDVIAPPDFILNSVLGASDGQVYRRLQSAIYRNPYAMSRPSWWQDIVNYKKNIVTKL